jgi:hypothetical protein
MPECAFLRLHRLPGNRWGVGLLGERRDLNFRARPRAAAHQLGGSEPSALVKALAGLHGGFQNHPQLQLELPKG